MKKRELAGILIGAVLLVGVLSWMFTAPYLGNTGLARTPGVILGGTPTPAEADFTPLNESVRLPLLMKQSGFPPFVTYLSWVGTADGVITATHPDGALWAQHVRDHGGDGWLRICAGAGRAKRGTLAQPGNPGFFVTGPRCLTRWQRWC